LIFHYDFPPDTEVTISAPYDHAAIMEQMERFKIF